MNIIHITLSNLKDTILKTDKNEKGIAILLSLGLLSLLAVLALTFATTATINKKVAKNNNDLSNARILVKSIINRAILSKSDSVHATTETLKSTGKNTLSNESNTESLYELFPTVLNGISYYTSAKYAIDNPEWQYIEVDTSPDTTIIIGRIAFAHAKYADKGWIVPAAVVDNPQTGNTAVNEYEDSNPPQYTSTDSSGNKIEGRPGVNVNEIWLGAFDGILKNTVDNNEIQKMSSNKSPGGLMPNTGWGNSDNFFNALKITNSEDKNTLLDYFVFSSENKNPEAYWTDNNSDNIKDYDELYSRFDLTRDWNQLNNDVNSILGATDIKFPDSTNAIPWLKNWKDKGDFPNVAACRKQIIANLIDYNDSNDDPTTDYDTTNGKPTYFGNENYPALNEVVIQLTIGIKRHDQYQPESEPIQKTGLIEINLYNPNSQIELLRLPNQKTGDYQTKLNIKFSFDGDEIPNNLRPSWFPDYNPYETNDEYSLTIDRGENYPYEFNFSSTPETIELEYSGTNASVQDPSIGTISNIPRSNINKMIIHEASIELLYNGKVVDFAYLSMPCEKEECENSKCIHGNRIEVEIKHDNGDSINPTSSHPVNYAFFMQFEAKDPMQNFTPSSWKDASSPGLDDSMGEWHQKDVFIENNNISHSLGSNNPAYEDRIINIGTGTDTDIETANLVELSTAFFRNAPMKSPWELGLINRGKVWQTINLKKYNATEGIDILTGGGNAYSDGDANIFDQIKMTPNNDILGKINLNVSQSNILRALFQGIATNSKYINPGAINPIYPHNDIVLDASDALDLETAIISHSTYVNSFRNRSEVVNVITGAVDGSLVTQTNDASQEEIIGKFINLTQASPIMQSNELPIIAIVQTIDDLGVVKINLDLDNDGHIGYADESSLGFDLNGDGDKTDIDINEKNIETEFGRYDQFADKITATQKVLVKLYQTNTGGKYRIKHLEYIND